MSKNCIGTIFIGVITGLAGQGKTLLAKTMLLKLNLPTIVIDRQSQFEKGVMFNDTTKLWNWIVSNEDFFYSKHPVLILQTDKEDEEILFKQLYEKLQNPKRKHPKAILLVCDEIDDYFKNNARSYLEKVVKFARNRQINIIATLKRPQGIHKILETQATDTFYFRSFNNLDLEKCRKTFGKDISEELKSLDRLEFLRVQNRAGDDGNFICTKEIIPDYIFKFV